MACGLPLPSRSTQLGQPLAIVRLTQWAGKKEHDAVEWLVLHAQLCTLKGNRISQVSWIRERFGLSMPKPTSLSWLTQFYHLHNISTYTILPRSSKWSYPHSTCSTPSSWHSAWSSASRSCCWRSATSCSKRPVRCSIACIGHRFWHIEAVSEANVAFNTGIYNHTRAPERAVNGHSSTSFGCYCLTPLIGGPGIVIDYTYYYVHICLSLSIYHTICYISFA